MERVMNGALNSYFKRSFFYTKLLELEDKKGEQIRLSKRRFKTNYQARDKILIIGHTDIETKIDRTKILDDINYVSNVLVQIDDIVSVSTKININRNVNKHLFDIKSSLDYLFPIEKEKTNADIIINEKYVKIDDYVVHINDYDEDIIDIYPVKSEFDMLNGLHHDKLKNEKVLEILTHLKQRLDEKKELLKII